MSSSDKEIALELTKLTVEIHSKNSNIKSPYARLDVQHIQDIYMFLFTTLYLRLINE